MKIGCNYGTGYKIGNLGGCRFVKSNITMNEYNDFARKERRLKSSSLITKASECASWHFKVPIKDDISNIYHRRYIEREDYMFAPGRTINQARINR